jgi:hypothetical protein
MARFTFLMDYNTYLKQIYNLNKHDDFKIYETSKVEKLNEGLIKTQPTELSVRILQKRFPTLIIEMRELYDITIEGEMMELKNYLPIINNLGYFISLLTIDGENWISEYNDNTIPLCIFLEPKYDVIINPLPKKLYHATLSKNDNNILKIGLYPKSNSKISKHPERIYLTDSLERAKEFGIYLTEINQKPHSIFELNTDNLKINLYRDINMADKGFYTINNIPPNNITKIV